MKTHIQYIKQIKADAQNKLADTRSDTDNSRQVDTKQVMISRKIGVSSLYLNFSLNLLLKLRLKKLDN